MLIKLQDTNKRNQRWHKTDGGIYHVLGLEETILWRWLYTQRIYRFNTIPVKLPVAFIIELEPKIFTVLMETQKIPSSQSSLKK